MANYLSGKALRRLVLGEKVTRAAALLPATTTGNIFTVTGGRVLITSFLGVAVTASPATTNTLKVSVAPASGTGADLCTAVSVASQQAGSQILLPDPVAAASNLVVTTAGGNAPTSAHGFVVPAGTITLTTTGTAATGTWQWDLTYVPIDDGAAVAAA
jgi:hypothetical protein